MLNQGFAELICGLRQKRNSGDHVCGVALRGVSPPEKENKDVRFIT
jgi:hypothetical protein